MMNGGMRLLLVLSLVAVLVSAPLAAPPAQASTDRLAATAADPSEAAIQLSREAFADGVAAWAVIARDDVFADALAAAPVAGTTGPVLFTGSDRLQPATRAELERVLPAGATVYLMGGTQALDQQVEQQLRDRWSVQRVAGSNRLLTAVAADRLVAARDRGGQPAKEVLLTTATNWPDAVTAGAAAVRTGAGLLLLDGSQPPETGSNAVVLDRLRQSGTEQVTVVGGPAALPQPHYEAAAAHAVRARRIAGSERAGTAVAVARQLWEDTNGGLVVRGFPDPGGADGTSRAWGWALAASGAAARSGRPLLLAHGFRTAGTWDGVTLATAELLAGLPCAAELAVVGRPESGVSQATAVEVDRLRCGADPEVDVSVVADRLQVPWGVADLGDGRILVTERDRGTVRMVQDGNLLSDPVWTAPDLYSEGEAGLMDIIAQPDFRQTARLLVCGTQHPGPRIKVLRLLMLETARAGLMEEVADVGAAARHHDGCALAFDHQGNLLVTVGDAGIAQDARDPAKPNGKVHRMRLDASPVAGNAAGTVWTVGHRNPQGLAPHPVSSAVLEVEHGPDDHDEVNLLATGGDYGWPNCSGPCEVPGVTNPIWSSGSSTIATSGAAVATDPGWDRLRGALLIATLRDRTLRALPLTPAGDAAAGPPVTLIDGSYGRLRAVEPAAGGGVWVTTSNCGGGCTTDMVLRVTARPGTG